VLVYLHPEPVKEESKPVEPPKVEAAHPEPVKEEPKVEAPVEIKHVEPIKEEPKKVDPPKVELAHPEPIKEEPKVDSSKIENSDTKTITEEPKVEIAEVKEINYAQIAESTFTGDTLDTQDEDIPAQIIEDGDLDFTEEDIQALDSVASEAGLPDAEEIIEKEANELRNTEPVSTSLPITPKNELSLIAQDRRGHRTLSTPATEKEAQQIEKIDVQLRPWARLKKEINNKTPPKSTTPPRATRSISDSPRGYDYNKEFQRFRASSERISTASPIESPLSTKSNSDKDSEYNAKLTRLKENDPTLTEFIKEEPIPLGSLGMQELADAVKINTNVKIFSLCRNELNDDAVFRSVALSITKNKSIQILKLASNGITAQGAKEIAGLITKNTSITQIDLSHNSFGDAGAKYISEALKNTTRLISLDLSRNGFTFTGVAFLSSAVEYNNIIQTLNIEEKNIEKMNAKESVGHNKINRRRTQSTPGQVTTTSSNNKKVNSVVTTDNDDSIPDKAWDGFKIIPNNSPSTTNQAVIFPISAPTTTPTISATTTTSHSDQSVHTASHPKSSSHSDLKTSILPPTTIPGESNIPTTTTTSTTPVASSTNPEKKVSSLTIPVDKHPSTPTPTPTPTPRDTSTVLYISGAATVAALIIGLFFAFRRK